MWQGTEAEIDLVPGGVWRVNVTGDGFASAVWWRSFRTNGSCSPGAGNMARRRLRARRPSRSSSFPKERGTLIRLTHSALPPDQIEIHRHGWEHYVPRLAAVCEGRVPGPNTPGA